MALEYLEKALALEKQAQNHKNMADIFLNISVVLSNLNKHKDALDAVLNAIFLVQEELLDFTLPQSFHVAFQSTTTQNSVSETQGNYLGSLIKPRQTGRTADPRGSAPVVVLIDERFDNAEDYGRFLKERVKVLVIAYHNMGAELEHLNLYHDALKIYQKGLKLADQYLGSQSEVAIELQSILDVLKNKLSGKSRPVIVKPPLSQSVQRQHFTIECGSEMTRTIKSRIRRSEGEPTPIRQIDSNVSHFERDRKSVIIKSEKGNAYLQSKQKLDTNATPNPSRETLVSKTKISNAPEVRINANQQNASRPNLDNNSIELGSSSKVQLPEISHSHPEDEARDDSKQKDQSVVRFLNKQSTHSIGNNPSSLKKSNTLPVYSIRKDMREKNKGLEHGPIMTDPAQQFSGSLLQQMKMGTVRSEIALLQDNLSNQRSPVSSTSDQAQKNSFAKSQVSINIRNVTFSKGQKTENLIKNDRIPGQKSTSVVPSVIQVANSNHIKKALIEILNQTSQNQNDTADFNAQSQAQKDSKDYTVNIKPICDDFGESIIHQELQDINLTLGPRGQHRSSLGIKQEIYHVKLDSSGIQDTHNIFGADDAPLDLATKSSGKKPQKGHQESAALWQDEVSNLDSSGIESSYVY